jgi:hypothetical protein
MSWPGGMPHLVTLLRNPSHVSPTVSPHLLERSIGRGLAHCVHPLAAWRVASRRYRYIVVAGYGTLGYLAGLIALFIWQP